MKNMKDNTVLIINTMCEILLYTFIHVLPTTIVVSYMVCDYVQCVCETE